MATAAALERAVAQSLEAALSQRCIARCSTQPCQNYVLGAAQLQYDDPMTLATAPAAVRKYLNVPTCPPTARPCSVGLHKLADAAEAEKDGCSAFVHWRPDDLSSGCILLILMSFPRHLSCAGRLLVLQHVPHPQSRTTAST